MKTALITGASGGLGREIALQCGFCDGNHLTKVFRSITGLYCPGPGTSPFDASDISRLDLLWNTEFARQSIFSCGAAINRSQSAVGGFDGYCPLIVHGNRVSTFEMIYVSGDGPAPCFAHSHLRSVPLINVDREHGTLMSVYVPGPMSASVRVASWTRTSRPFSSK